MLSFVTSFNASLYKSYGQRFLRSWQENVRSEGLSLWVAFEGDIPNEIKTENPSVNFFSAHTSLSIRFLQKFGHFIEARGYQLTEKVVDGAVERGFAYNYRKDAVRFSFKIFALKALLDSLPAADGDHLCWIDADCVVQKPFDAYSFSRFLPAKDEIASYLGRDKFPPPIPYTEGGFVGYSLNQDGRDFIEHMLSTYMTGDIFVLPQWHDCMVFDSARTLFEGSGFKFKNISGVHSGTDHPFAVSELSEYFDHLKGPERKKLGYSPERLAK